MRLPWWRRWTDGAWNRDYAWFRADEARAWLPETIETGAEHAVPAALVRRVVCLHLVDNVRGQVFPFDAADVRAAELTAVVREFDAGGIAVLDLRGRSHAEVAEGEFPRGFVAELRGAARWDVEAGRFVAFELVATGERWGRSRFNGRERDRGRAPIGVVLRLAAADAPRVAPAFVWRYGWRPTARK